MIGQKNNLGRVRGARPRPLHSPLTSCLWASVALGWVACTASTDGDPSGDPSGDDSSVTGPPEVRDHGGTGGAAEPDPRGSGGTHSSGGSWTAAGTGGTHSSGGSWTAAGTGGRDSTDAAGGTGDTGGSGDTGEGNPEVCTLDSPVAGLPPYDFTMHNVLTKTMPRKDFCDADKWYSEWLDAEGQPVQEFGLHEGDDMADYVEGGRSHQRCEFEGGLLVTKGEGKWIEWEGRMLVNQHPEITITIGQMFGPNGPDARIEMRKSGSIGVGSLNGGAGNVTLTTDDMVGESFKIKMRTNGERVEVYFNGSKRVDRPTDGNDGQRWHFRWGVYSNDIPTNPTPLTNTVTELVVTG